MFNSEQVVPIYRGKLTGKRLNNITKSMHHRDGTIIDESVLTSRKTTIKCKGCKSRFNEDDIDKGIFIAELSLCDPCLEKETTF